MNRERQYSSNKEKDAQPLLLDNKIREICQIFEAVINTNQSTKTPLKRHLNATHTFISERALPEGSN